MPKKRQIPFLHEQRLADGTIVYHWKPSPTLRRAGFQNVKLGTDYSAAVARAIALNKQVEAWRAGQLQPHAEKARSVLRVVRFDELVRRYRQAPEFTMLADSSKSEYGSRLRQLEAWATTKDGPIRADCIDMQMVMSLRDITMQGEGLHKAAALIRVLRLLLEWGVRADILKSNVAAHVKIVTPPAREKILSPRTVMALAAMAEQKGDALVALAIELAFWTTQRQGDLLQRFTRHAWQEISLPDLLPRHRTALVDAKGAIHGFQLRQNKTGAWVGAPVPPALHGRITAAFRASNKGWLFYDPRKPDRAMPKGYLQARWREVLALAIAAAEAADDARMLAELKGAMFRDLRRSGMSFYSIAGAKLPWITALSGHMVIGRRTILDTYMPANTEGAAACVATGILWLRQQQKRDRAQGETA